MKARSQRLRLATVLLILPASACCRLEDSDALPVPPPYPAAADVPSSLPPDRLAPRELAEGREEAFGVILPRAFKVVQRFPDSVFADSDTNAEAASNYLRRHLDARGVEIGPSRTIFTAAHAKGKESERVLRVEVVAKPNGSQIVVRDVTPPPPIPGLSEEERWRRAGLKPNGEPLDPTHLD